MWCTQCFLVANGWPVGNANVVRINDTRLVREYLYEQIHQSTFSSVIVSYFQSLFLTSIKSLITLSTFASASRIIRLILGFYWRLPGILLRSCKSASAILVIVDYYWGKQECYCKEVADLYGIIERWRAHRIFSYLLLPPPFSPLWKSGHILDWDHDFKVQRVRQSETIIWWTFRCEIKRVIALFLYMLQLHYSVFIQVIRKPICWNFSRTMFVEGYRANLIAATMQLCLSLQQPDRSGELGQSVAVHYRWYKFSA